MANDSINEIKEEKYIPPKTRKHLSPSVRKIVMEQNIDVSNNNSNEKFPFRVNIEPNVILKPEKSLDALQIAPTMEYIKKWPPERWYMAFYGMLHILSQRDFNFIEGEMDRVYKLNR